MHIDPAVTDEFLDILATVAAIPVTPFGPDGAVDWDGHARLIRRLVGRRGHRWSRRTATPASSTR